MSSLLKLLLLFLPSLAAGGEACFAFKDLKLPTSYKFSFSSEAVYTKWLEMSPARFGEIYTFRSADYGGTGDGFGFSGDYCRRYWKCAPEPAQNPPESGRIGTIEAQFSVTFKALGQETLVETKALSFKQQTGRRWAISPHFRKIPVFKKVHSDTYFEYLFLRKLGALLGQSGMPDLLDEEGNKVDIESMTIEHLEQLRLN